MKQGQFIISGYINGQKFRPSNWSERLCEVGAIFDPLKRVMRYSEHLYPRQCEKYGCSVYVDFDALNNELQRYIHWFMESNGMDAVPLHTTKPSPILTEVVGTSKPMIAFNPGPPVPKQVRRRKVAA